MSAYPSRIVCLTEEPTEVLYGLGEQHRIVGISQFTRRPPEAREEKPRVSGFTSARLDKVIALEPDLVIGFSDIQADIARDLIKQGVEVWISNHRTIDGILGYIRRLGGMVGRADAADAWADSLGRHLDEIKSSASELFRRPRVYFEEWNDPMISGIGWVSEIIGIAGGDDIFAERAGSSLANDRIVDDPLEVPRLEPDLMLASWCGKKFQPDQVWSRPGWESIVPVKTRTAYEIPAEIILQPGPAALSDGVDEIHRIIKEWAGTR